MEENNEEYKIKVNKTFINKETINNITNQNKKNPIKKSILYKLKFNPEIIINQFHQTSNNINTNINIKKDNLRNSEYIGRNDNNIFEDNNETNIYSPNKYFHSYDDDNFEREEENNVYIYNNTYTNVKSMEKDSKSIENKISNLYEEYSPLTSRINHYNNTTYRERNPFIKNIKFNQLTKQKMKISEYIIQNPKEERKINKFVRPKTERNKKINKFNINNNNDVLEAENNNIYSNRPKNLNKRIRQLSQEEISISNKEKIYNKRRNISMNLRNNYNTTISEGIYPFNDKTFKKNIEEYLFTDYNINRNLYKNIIDSKEKYNSNTFVDWNKHKALNIKLMNYRIKLFTQFFIHFEKYYRAFLRNYKNIFFNIIKYYHYKKKNIDVNFSYKKKSKKDRNSLYYNSIKKENKGVKSNNKFSTTYNYYYSDKNNIIYLDIKSSLLNKLETKEDVNYNSSLTEFPKNILNTTSRKKENICFSDRKRIIKKSLIDSLTKSPISIIGNRTSRNQGFNFGNENNEKENELFRSFEELNKKGEQIKRRKKSKNAKEKIIANILNSQKANEKNIIKKIKDTKEYGQFSELRKNTDKNNNYNTKNLKDNNTPKRNSKINLENNYNKTLFNWYPKKEKELENDNIKYTRKNKILNAKTINNKKLNKSNINISNKFTSYRKVKINNNKNPLIGNKQFKILKNNKSNTKNNNKTKKNIYYNKNKSELKEKGSKLIYKIKTNDNRIHINIFYYNYSSKNKTSYKKYKSLHEIKNFSMNLINNNDFITKNRTKEIKNKKLLSSIKEEEPSNQNSRILDESATPFNLNDINEENNSKELIISQFINIIETILIHIYKRILFFRIKTINIINKMDEILFNNDKKKKIYHKKNNSTQIYSKKLGIKVQKKIKNEENKSGFKPKKIQMECWIKRINKLRQILIFYALNKND